MSITVPGFVKNGVVVPNAPLLERARVEAGLVAALLQVKYGLIKRRRHD
jgi:hypothetical protein